MEVPDKLLLAAPQAAASYSHLLGLPAHLQARALTLRLLTAGIDPHSAQLGALKHCGEHCTED